MSISLEGRSRAAHTSASIDRSALALDTKRYQAIPGENAIGSNDPAARDRKGRRIVRTGVGDRTQCIRVANATCKRRVGDDRTGPNLCAELPTHGAQTACRELRTTTSADDHFLALPARS